MTGQNVSSVPKKDSSSNRSNGKTTAGNETSKKTKSNKTPAPKQVWQEVKRDEKIEKAIIVQEIKQDNEIKKLSTNQVNLRKEINMLKDERCTGIGTSILTYPSAKAAFSVTNPMKDKPRHLPTPGNPSQPLGRPEELAALDDLLTGPTPAGGNVRIIFDPTSPHQVYYSVLGGAQPNTGGIALMTYSIAPQQNGRGISSWTQMGGLQAWGEQDGSNLQFPIHLAGALIPTSDSVRLATGNIPAPQGSHAIFLDSVTNLPINFTDVNGNVTPFLPIGHKLGSAFYDTAIPAVDSATAGWDVYYVAHGSTFSNVLIYYNLENPSNIITLSTGTINNVGVVGSQVQWNSLSPVALAFISTQFTVVTDAKQSLPSSTFRVTAFEVVAQCTASDFGNGGSIVTKVTQQSINPPNGITNQQFVSFGNMIRGRFETGSDALYIPSDKSDWMDLKDDPLNNPWTGPNCSVPYYKFTTIMQILTTGNGSGPNPSNLSMQFFGACYIECSTENQLLSQDYADVDPYWPAVRQAMLETLQLHHNPDHEESRMEWFKRTINKVIHFGKDVITNPVVKEMINGTIELAPFFLEALLL